MDALTVEEFTGLNDETDPADRRLVARFSVQAKLDWGKTQEANPPREVYKEVEYVTILIPGDKTLSVHRPVQPSDKVRFAQQYRAFKAQKGQPMVGTPLAGWPLITEGQRKELEYFNIMTVEALAGVADNYASNMMGVQQLKQAAQKFLEAKQDNAPIAFMTKQLEERDSQLAAMQEQLKTLAAAVEASAKKPAPSKLPAVTP